MDTPPSDPLTAKISELQRAVEVAAAENVMLKSELRSLQRDVKSRPGVRKNVKSGEQLDDRTVDAIQKLVSDGMTVMDACETFSVSRATFYR